MADNMNLNEMLRRMAMAGLGAVTLTVEKSKELADMLFKKGEKAARESELTPDQVRDQVAEGLKNLADKIHTGIKKAEFEDLLARMDDLTDEERDILRERLDNPVPRAESCAQQPDDAPADHEAACGEGEEDSDSDKTDDSAGE
ncbi:MAG: hypothetical protein IJJ23_06325 [Clostridia bacterium]|nr:hypothetical protein [Clostridia bacterium]